MTNIRTPEFGRDYDVGFVGFTDRTGSFVSDGISWFERWAKRGEICVEHTFIVSGPVFCIEAQPSGTQYAPLSKYFTDRKVRTFFSRPRCWTPALGQHIVASMSKLVGQKYGFGLIAADAIANTWLGHWTNKLTWNLPNKIVSWLMDGRNTGICSEQVAKALNAQPELRGLGCLVNPPRMITPQMLFEDRALFE